MMDVIMISLMKSKDGSDLEKKSGVLECSFKNIYVSFIVDLFSLFSFVYIVFFTEGGQTREVYLKL